MHITTQAQHDKAVIEQAKADYAKNPSAGPMVNPFVNIFEGWDWRRKAGFYEATMHETLIDAAIDALEPHYRCTVMFDLAAGTVTPMDLSRYGDQIDQERKTEVAADRRYNDEATSIYRQRA